MSNPLCWQVDDDHYDDHHDDNDVDDDCVTLVDRLFTRQRGNRIS